MTIKNIFTIQIRIGELDLPFNLLQLLLKIVIPLTIAFVLYKFLKIWILMLLSKTRLKEEKKENAFRWIKLSLKVILLIYIILLVVGLLGKQVNAYILAFKNVLTFPIVENISIVTILLILPILYLGQVLGKVSQSFTKKNFLPYFSKLTPGGKQTFSAVVKNITASLVILFGLTIIGIDLSILIGLLGVVGIGLGFGLQGVVANLFAGIVILVSKPVKVGDHIIIDGTEGTLEEVRFLNSVISTLTHESIIIPNSKIVDNPIHNFSFDDANIIIRNTVGVSYNSDLDRVLEVMHQVAEACPFRLKHKEISTRVYSFDDSGISVGVICWIRNSRDKFAASSWINLEIWRAFKREGIEIPFPQVDLHIKKP